MGYLHSFSPLHRSLLLLLIVSGVIAGCTDSNPTDPGSDPNVDSGLGVGTSYTLSVNVADRDGKPVPHLTDTVTVTLEENKSSYQGRQNVHKYTVSTGEMSYVTYDSDGNLAVYYPPQQLAQQGQQGQTKPGWFVYPVNGGSFDTLIYSKVVPSSGVTTRTEAWFRAEYVGEETVTVPAGTFNARKLKLMTEYRNEVRLDASNELILMEGAEVRIEMWYSPELKYAVRQTSVTEAVIGYGADLERQVVNSSLQQLIDYTLK